MNLVIVIEASLELQATLAQQQFIIQATNQRSELTSKAGPRLKIDSFSK
jgi:hypothetical protein